MHDNPAHIDVPHGRTDNPRMAEYHDRDTDVDDDTRAMFCGLCAEGFTDDQALTILGQTMLATAQQNGRQQ